ncbi:MAG: hypothetical protein Q8Q04_01410 [archaeon]|nr:hypothetical protein [archaeon]
MIDIKEKLREMGESYRFFASIIPNSYSATTIKDFLDNRELIQSTKTFFPLGIFFYNSALVMLVNSVIYNEVEKNFGRLSDLNGSFIFPFSEEFLNLKEKKPIEDGDRIYQVFLQYYPKTDLKLVSLYEVQGPPSSERNPKTEFQKKLGLEF